MKYKFTNKELKYYLAILISAFLIAYLFCFHSSFKTIIESSIYDKEIRENKIEKQNDSVIVNLPEKNSYLIRIKGEFSGQLPSNCTIILNKYSLLSFPINKQYFQKEIVATSNLTEKGKNTLDLVSNKSFFKIVEINIQNYRGFNSHFPKLIVAFGDSRNLLQKVLAVNNLLPYKLSLLMTYLFVVTLFYLLMIITKPIWESKNYTLTSQLKTGLISILPSVLISITTIITNIVSSYYIVWNLQDIFISTFAPFIIINLIIGYRFLTLKSCELIKFILQTNYKFFKPIQIVYTFIKPVVRKISDKLLINNTIYYILFLILFSVFFIYNFPSRPQEMNETSSFDTDIRVTEYKNNNNLSLEKTKEIWDSVSGMNFHSYPLYQSIYSAPLYSLIRSYFMKLPLHPMTSFNLLNLLIAIFFFYSAYLLLKLLFGNGTAIKTLIIMLSFSAVYTVTRFSGRGYIVIGLSFILLGCYFIWKSIISGKRHYLIFAGISMGFSWTAGNHMTKLTPAFLLITFLFYTFSYFKRKGFSFRNSLCILLDFSIIAVFLSLTAIIIIKIVSYHFGPDLNFNYLLFNSDFRKASPLKYAFIWDIREILRRFRILFFLPQPRDIVNCYDEFLYNQSLIPVFFILFLIFSIFHLKKNFKSYNFIYAAIFAITPLIATFFIDATFPYPSWGMRYYMIFLPFAALLVVFGINYYFDFLALKIKDNFYRTTIATCIIIIISITFITRIYNVTFGDYSQSWSHCSTIGGYRESADALKRTYEKYDKTITIHNHFFTDFILTYFDFDLNHKFRNLDDSCLNPKSENSLSKLFDKFTKDNGKVLIILPRDKEESIYNKILGSYPKIELELIEDLQMPKKNSHNGPGLSLYLVKKI